MLNNFSSYFEIFGGLNLAYAGFSGIVSIGCEIGLNLNCINKSLKLKSESNKK